MDNLTDETQQPEQDFMAQAETQLRESQRRLLQARALELQQARDAAIAKEARRQELVTFSDDLAGFLDRSALDKAETALVKSVDSFLKLSSEYDDRLMDAHGRVSGLTGDERKEHGLSFDHSGVTAGQGYFQKPRPQTMLSQVIRVAIQQYYPRFSMSIDTPID